MVAPGHCPVTRDAPSPAEFIAAGFRAGLPLRPLLDRVCEKHGSAAWGSVGQQRELVDACFDAPIFTYGLQRERRFLRLLFDEVDRDSRGDVAPELTEAAVLRRITVSEEQPFCLIKLNHTRLRCSVATSNVGMRLWDAGVALHEALGTSGNDIRAACEGKRVLEIGSGVGLSCTAMRMAQVASAVLTELPGATLDNLKYNVTLNECDDFTSCLPLDVEDSGALKAAKLTWAVDIVLAADVCYEPGLVRSMLRAFAELITGSPRKGFMLATRRSDEMYNIFCRVSIGPFL
jgi:predicted nicotinamide N-methyase